MLTLAIFQLHCDVWCWWYPQSKCRHM